MTRQADLFGGGEQWDGLSSFSSANVLLSISSASSVGDMILSLARKLFAPCQSNHNRRETFERRRRKTCLQMHLPLLGICTIINFTLVAGEGASSNDGLGENEWILVILSLLIAFCISVFGSVVGYMSMLDDAITKHYKSHGEILNADVVSTVFTKGRRSGFGFGLQEGNEPEYTLVVEYSRIISDKYHIRIRKQVRARESDFVYPDFPHFDMQKHVDSLVTRDSSDEEVDAESNLFPRTFQEENRKLELYVLEDHPRSGFPVHQVERACSLHYRLSTLVFAGANMLFAMFVLFVTAHRISEQDDEKSRVAWICFWIFVCLFLSTLPVIHCLLNKLLKGALEEEYYESGEWIPTGQEDSSSLSSGNDSYLWSQYHVMLS
jgi:hypothetical protein